MMAARNCGNADFSDEEMELESPGNNDEEGGLRIDDDIYIPPPPLVNSLDENGPRLIISKLVNVDFKSFGEETTVGPFHECFSAIVGPNGSGKSNVIDSMLFVFGYRASKIRSKKISVLIHNSSEHPNCTSCTVLVYFQKIINKPGQGYDIVPNSEIVVSRTAFKDNSSYYQLNGKKVQFKEVAKLLADNGVDLNYNRFLILQGEVEQIAMMKPKAQTSHDTGMLEFLEDIIGTARYKEPLEKLAQKVELLTENRIEHFNRLQIAEEERAALEKPMQEAVQYLKSENTISKLQHRLYHCKKLKAQVRCAEEESKKTEVETDYKKLTEEMHLVEEKKHEKQSEFKEKSKKREALQNKKDNLTSSYDEIKKKDEQLHAELVETNKRRKANMTLIGKEKSKLEDLGQVRGKNEENIKECAILHERCLAERDKEEAALVTLMDNLKVQTKPLLEQRKKFEVDLIPQKKNVDQARGNFEIAQSSLQLYTVAEESEKKKLEELQLALQNTVQLLEERKQQIKSFEAKIPATEKSLFKAKKEFETIKQQDIEASSRLKNTRIQVTEQKSAMNASKSRNKVLDALMQQKRQGNIPGISGRLGNLGAIDAKYDVAISTACGPLDNIVVDTVDTAQRCIAFLRQNDIGRATFIALEKQQKFWPHCREKIKTPENVPRLFDLIRVEDESVLPAFYYGLRNTLVATNLDQATRIAYGAQRHRVVTLKGELIETSGTMSGGGKTVFQGRMGQSVVRAEPCIADIEKLQIDLDKVYQECEHLKERQQQLEPQIYSLTTALADMKMDQQKYSIEVQSLMKQKLSLESQLKVQKIKAAQTVSDPKEVQKLTEVLKLAEEKLEKAEAESQAIEHEVAKLNAKIEKISGDKVKNQQKIIADLLKKINKFNAEIGRLQVGIKTAESDSKKVAKHIETLEIDVHNSENKIRKIQQEKVGLEKQAGEILQTLNEVAEELVETEDVFTSFNAEISALQDRENKMKSLKIELNQKIKESNKNFEAFKQKIVAYEKKISALKLQVVPGEAAEQFEELTEEQVRELDEEAITELLAKVKSNLPDEIPNMQLIEEYWDKDRLYSQRTEELKEITARRNKIQHLYEDNRQRRVQEFLKGFLIISSKLKEIYQMITLGGDAELELVDSLDPFYEGIVFSVRPPKKSWKNISDLSGGEKTLSSLALVFALHHYKPAPFYFMDEIDAALDFKNVSIVGNYIKERTKNTQFIVISLRSNMSDLASYLVGIYKTYNSTKCAVLDITKFCNNTDVPLPTSNSMQMESETHNQVTSSQHPETEISHTDVISESSELSSDSSTEESQLTLTNRAVSPSEPSNKRRKM